MIDYVNQNGLKGLRLIYPKNIKPTRPNVVNKKKLEIIAGGVNHFPSFPIAKNTTAIDSILNNYNDEDDYKIINIEFIKEIIENCEAEFNNDWPHKTYIKCIESLQEKDSSKAILIVRRNRNIGRNTGTLLSPNDRKLGDQFDKQIVLTMYRIDGNIDKGWDGAALWIPNIKFPKDKFFYNIEE